MNSFLGRSLLTLLIICSLASLSACGSGGSDMPFVFDDGSSGSPSGSTNPPPATGSCSANTDCTAPQTCDTSTHTCKSPVAGGCVPACSTGQVCDTATSTCRAVTCSDDPTICDSATQKCDSGQCVCDPAKTTCGLPPTACQVDFAATIVLKVDDAANPPPGSPEREGHYDSPSACDQYSGSGGYPGPLDPASIGAFLVPPSNNTDLYCCSAAQETAGQVIGNDSFGNELFCDTQNRHGNALEVAATRWLPNPQSAKIKLKFDLSSGCRVSIITDEFPKYYLENSALDASLIIDAGKDYQTFPNGIDFATLNPTYPTRRLNDPEMVGDCSTSTDASGNLQVAVTNLPLRFFVQLFANVTKDCLLSGACSGTSFAQRLNGLADGSFQIIPGTNSDPLMLTTSSDSQDPVVPAHQTTAMTIQGAPLHFDTGSNESRMSLVTAFKMPETFGTSRDDNLGTGQLQAQLGSGILSAEVSGRVTKQNGSSIQTLTDLTTNCGGGGGGTQRLELSMSSTFGATPESLTITGDPTHPTEPFTAEACVPGSHLGGSCQFAADLPFAKDAGAGDPLSGVEAKFAKDGTLVIQNAGASTVSMALHVPETAGAFRIMNADALQDVTLAPGNRTTLNVRFDPVVSGNGCATTAGVVNCDASLSISTSHTVTIALKGRAKLPAAEIKLEELATASPYTVVGSALIPGAASPTVDFGEATVSIETKTKLYKISNTGVRPLVVTNILAQDASRNFRVGSIYQGTDFEHREWRIGQRPWMVNPSGNNPIFFFLNYGPFGRVSDESAARTCGRAMPQPTRCDGGSLLISTASAGDQSVLLSGKATRDTRAILDLYFQDDKRFLVTNDDDNPSGFAGPEHLYLAQKPMEADQVFSFRQDTVTRSVYLRNGNGISPQLDSLVLTAVPAVGGANADKFTFTASVTATVDTPLVVAPYQIIKIGDMTFPAAAGATYKKFFAQLPISAQSRPSAPGAATRPPVIGGYFTPEGAIDKSHAADTVNVKIGRSVNAPNETKDLKIHRLFAGFDNPLVAQASRMVSSTTRGIATRGGLTGSQLNQFTETYTIDSALNFNAENGTVTLIRVFTPVVPTGPTSSVPGVRLFNGPGSQPVFQYHFQCVNGLGQCGFFYIYIGDWSSTGRPSSPQPPPCGNKSPISADPGNNSTPPVVALDPRVPAEAACMQDPTNGLAPATGIYDPVTGEVTFSNLAIRLFSPDTPQTEGVNKHLDTTLHLALTTECVTSALTPDTNALPLRLVPTQTLAEPLPFVTDSGFTNPLTEYVGDYCADAREMHGRRMGLEDTTGTLDNDADADPDALPPGTFNFDLVAVGKVKAGSFVTSAPFRQANKMMYIVIKAEAGYLCANGIDFVPISSMCSPPE